MQPAHDNTATATGAKPKAAKPQRVNGHGETPVLVQHRQLEDEIKKRFGPEQGEPNALRKISRETFDAIEPSDEEDLVYGVLARSGIGALYGPVGSGKSLVALDWSLRLAAGKKVANQECERVGVAYVAPEGAPGLRKRIKAWRKKHAAKGLPFVLIPVRLDLRSVMQPDVEALIATLREVAGEFEEKHGVPLGLVVIDTFAAATPGMVENSAEGMTAAVDALKAINEATRAFVLAVHHTGKDAGRGLRGNSAFLAALDTTIEVVLNDKGVEPTREVWVRKEKDDASNRSLFAFTIEVLEIGKTKTRGLPITAALMKHTGEPITIKPRGKRPSPSQGRILDAIAQLVSDKGETPPARCQCPSGVKAAREKDVIARAIEIGIGGGQKPVTAKRTARRAKVECLAACFAFERDGFLWLATK